MCPLRADGAEIITVKNHNLDEALHELVVEGGPLTRSLLGFRDIGFQK